MVATNADDKSARGMKVNSNSVQSIGARGFLYPVLIKQTIAT